MSVSMNNDESMINAAIELHDTEVVAVHRDGTTLRLDLKAFVHRSQGRPCIDHGSSWLQDATITLLNARWLDPEPGDWNPIYDGDIIVGDHVFRNCIACPFDSGTAATLDLILSNGDRVRINADRILLVLTGEGEYLSESEAIAQ